MDPGVPAQQLQEFIVKPEGEGDAHDTQTEVGEHGDGAELEQTGQTDHQPREHHTGLCRFTPVHQIHNYSRRHTHTHIHTLKTEEMNYNECMIS